MAEVAALIDRIRHEPFTDRHGNTIQVVARERHADLLQLVAQTGVRQGELGRITGADIDLKRHRIRVREPKDRSIPRYLEVTPGLTETVKRLNPADPEQ